MTKFRVELKHGQDLRIIEADRYDSNDNGWMIFYRKRLQGGIEEYWRVRLDCVISMETISD